MRKKSRKNSSARSSGGFDRITSSQTDFYSATPSEKPLNDDSSISSSKQVRKTNRHQTAAGRRADKMDPREKMALLAILKSVVMVLLLLIAFFLLWKGIGLYEESVWLDHADVPEKSPVLQEVILTDDFDILNQDSREQFAARIEGWKEADRLVRSADVLLHRNIYDQAIDQCQDALRKDPSHRGALERLGRLYYAKKDYVEAVNAYIRLLSVDPSQKKVQVQLIQALDAFGDYKAVKYMTEWYLDVNIYNVDVQRYLANALYAQESFEDAVGAYDRVLLELPDDVLALERHAGACMQVQKYEKALVSLSRLREKHYRNPTYYKQIIICNAQLDRSRDAVLTLGRAAELFGAPMVMGWIQDPKLDRIREDRGFQAFTDRVGGEEFRRQLEHMAQNMERRDEDKADAGLRLEMPTSEFRDEELLKMKQR